MKNDTSTPKKKNEMCEYTNQVNEPVDDEAASSDWSIVSIKFLYRKNKMK